MSLLDDVSIVVTPNGYKAGELYAVVPVPTEGTEEVTNGDFATDTDWTIGGTTFSAGAILLDDANDNVFQGWTDTVNTLYKLTITKTGLGTLRFRSGFAGSAATKIEIPESGIIYFTSTSDTNRIQIYGDENSINATLNSVSVKEYTSADMDVTRATAATRVDENGLVNYAEILGGEEVTNGDFATDLSGWTGQAGRGSYAWDNGKAKITNDDTSGYPNLSQSVTTVSGKVYKVNATVEIGTATLTEVRAYSGGVLGSQQLNTDGTIDFTFTAIGTSFTLHLYLFEAGNTGNYCFFDNISVKELTRDNVPRIDYTGGGCPHILAEPQRTNLITYSSDFTDSSWNLDGSNVNLTRTPNATTSPSGENNATKLIGNNISKDPNNSYIGVSTSAAAPYTTSVFAKKGEYDYLVSGIGSYASGYYAIFNLSNGTVSTQPTAADTTASIEDYGNGWYRCSVNTTNTGGGELLFISPSVDGTLTTNYTNTTNGIYVWGAQLEEGSYATSYIPTSGSTVTRNQDIFTRDGIGSLINSEEGVLFAELKTLANDSTNGRISLSDGTTANRMLLYSAANSIKFYVGVSGQSALAFTVTGVITEFNKVAISFKENDMKFYLNGVLVYSNTSAATFLANSLNTLQLADGNGQLNFFGKVKQLQVYKTALTDTELATLTTI